MNAMTYFSLIFNTSFFKTSFLFLDVLHNVSRSPNIYQSSQRLYFATVTKLTLHPPPSDLFPLSRCSTTSHGPFQHTCQQHAHPRQAPTATSTQPLSASLNIIGEDMPCARYTAYPLFSLLATLYQVILCMTFSPHSTHSTPIRYTWPCHRLQIQHNLCLQYHHGYSLARD